MAKDNPRIAAWVKWPDGLYEVTLLARIKDGEVAYHYLCPYTLRLEKILEKPVFCLRDWQYLKELALETRREKI